MKLSGAINTIKSFEIDKSCSETLPCEHMCKIILKDGSSKEAKLEADEIYAVVHGLGVKLIKGYLQEFDAYKDYKGDSEEYSAPSLEKVLAKIFLKKD